jgi:pre-mRNA-splicing factor ATP-dependent RNA helicase DHX16
MQIKRLQPSSCLLVSPLFHSTFPSSTRLIFYVLDIAKKAKTPSDLANQLMAAGFNDTPGTSAFAAEVHRRIPRETKATKAKAEHAAKVGLQKQRFSLIDDEPQVPSSADVPVKRSKKDKDKARPKFRKRDEDDWQSDEEERAAKRRREDERLEKPGRGSAPLQDGEAREEEEEDPIEAAERERLRDLAERDEFAARMKEKDKARTKQLVGEGSSKTRLRAEDPAAMPSLRERSRQEYLVKREQQQLDLLKLEISDFEALAHGQRLTKRELKELAKKKELLRLAEERSKIDDGRDGYVSLQSVTPHLRRRPG